MSDELSKIAIGTAKMHMRNDFVIVVGCTVIIAVILIFTIISYREMKNVGDADVSILLMALVITLIVCVSGSALYAFSDFMQWENFPLEKYMEYSAKYIR